MLWSIHRLYANIVPFHMRDLNFQGLWFPCDWGWRLLEKITNCYSFDPKCSSKSHRLSFGHQPVALLGDGLNFWKRTLLKGTKITELCLWRGCWDPSLSPFSFCFPAAVRGRALLYHMLLMWCSASPQTKVKGPSHYGSKSLKLWLKRNIFSF